MIDTPNYRNNRPKTHIVGGATDCYGLAMENLPKNDELIAQLTRIAEAMERRSPPPPKVSDVHPAEAYVWNAATQTLQPINKVNRLNIDLLQGIDQQRDTLLGNSISFARGLSANNALLWGARGTGKSSLVKAVHGTLMAQKLDCALVEIHREDIDDLPTLMSFLAQIDRRFILFCDDLAFEYGEATTNL